MNKGITIKDLINVGIFTAIYIVLFLGCSILVFIPVLMLFVPFVLSIVAGIPFLLFLTKANKLGMVTIMGTILGLLMFSTGHGWPVLVLGIGCGLIADLIFKSGEYKSWNKTVIGYCVFSSWCIGAFLPIWIMRDAYFEHHVSARFGNEGVSALLGLTSSYWMLAAIFVSLVIGSIIGAYIGRASLKKHFQRAGIA